MKCLLILMMIMACGAQADTIYHTNGTTTEVPEGYTVLAIPPGVAVVQVGGVDPYVVVKPKPKPKPPELNCVPKGQLGLGPGTVYCD